MQAHSIKHLYFIGIGGAGMVWLADWALAQGWQVSGSDGVESEVTKRLAAAGANIHYEVGDIPADITEAIISSAITETAPSYPELLELQKCGIPIFKRAEYAGKITRLKKTIAVCGTHGKTTTTAMIGWILDKAGLDPTVFVGGGLKEWGGATKIGKGEWLVIEADEFDRSFHRFSAEMAVVLNIDADHLDYYKGGIEEIRHSFKRFLRNLQVGRGIVAAYGRDKNIRQVCRGFKYKFHWYDEDHLWVGLKLRIPGTHNLLNATAAARIAHEIGVSTSVIREALATFPGVGRRFEYLGTWGKREVYDDYAHHPKEIAATLQGSAEKFAGQPFTLVFQPHQKARTLNLLKEFGRAFDDNPPTELILAPIYEVPGRNESEQVSSADIKTEIEKKMPAGLTVKAPADWEEVRKEVETACATPGFLMIMGAGDIRRRAEGWRLDK